MAWTQCKRGLAGRARGEGNGSQTVCWESGLDCNRPGSARRIFGSRKGGQLASHHRPRGFGFVEMATDDAAESAIKSLNGRDIKGRPIRVNEAQARSGGAGGGGGGG